MIFTVETFELQKAVAACARGTATRSSIPALEGLLIDAHDSWVSVTGYNLNLGIQTKIPATVREPGAYVLPARTLTEIVRKLPEELVLFKTTAGKSVCSIQSGCFMMAIAGYEAKDFPELPSVSEDTVPAVSLAQNALKEMIGATVFAVSKVDTRPIQTGVLFEVSANSVTDGDVGQAAQYLTLVAVDGFRAAINRVQLSEPASEGSFVVPGATLKEVQRMLSKGTDDTVSIYKDDRHVSFRFGDTVTVSRLLEGYFFDYKKTLASINQKFTMQAKTDELVAAVDRCALLINEADKRPVRCKVGDNRLVFSVTATLGNAIDEVAATGKGDETEVGFNHSYLLDALKALPSDDVALHFSSPIAPCVITAPEKTPAEYGDFLYLLLPVRIKPGA